MVDTNALKAEIVRNGYNGADCAKSIGVCPDTFYRKLKNGTFTLREAFDLAKLLNMKEPAKIFFAEKLS